MTKAQTIRLIEVTSQTQANNGTVCYHDPFTGVDYMSYESGYVRRKYSTTSWRTGRKLFVIYQLNKTRKVHRELTWFPGKLVECVERVLEMDPERRMDMICRAAINYRKTLGIRTYRN